MSLSDTICTCGAEPERDAMGNALPCVRCYFGSERCISPRERQLAVALRNAAVCWACMSLGPRDTCRNALDDCNTARRVIGVPAGMLARLEDDDGR